MPVETGRLDWNEAWRAARQRRVKPRGREAWDRRAQSFTRASDEYVEQMLALLQPEPTWTVLDVGSGAGTLAVPLARKVQWVTALDYSPRMVELLRGRCVEDGLVNVSAVLGAWEDDWDGLGIRSCDVAIASRSLLVDDLRGALLKLHRIARRKVFVTAPVGEGPVDRRVFDAVGRPWVAGPDYIYPYNVLHDLGIPATIAFVQVPDTRWYASGDDAFEGLLRTLPEPSAAEVARLRAWLDQTLVAGAEGVRLPSARTVRWAVLSWTPSQES